MSGFNPSTMSHVVGDLLDAALVEEGEPIPTSGDGRPGRRHVPVALRSDGAYAIGIHLGVLGASIALFDLGGHPVGQRRRLFHRDDDAPGLLARIAEDAEHLLRAANVSRERIVGIGVGAIGHVDPSAGVLIRSPHPPLTNAAIAGHLADATGLPVKIEHSVRAMALAENWFGQAVAWQDFVLVDVGSSIGAAIVANGEVVYGSGYGAGQLGHLTVDLDGPACWCGKRGCLDTVASGRAFVERVLAESLVRPGSVSSADPRAHGEEEVHRAVHQAALDLARHGDPRVADLIAEFGRRMGQAVAQLITVLSPQAVVFTGAITETEGLYLGAVRREVATAAFVDNVAAVDLVHTRLPDLPWLGAATLALRDVFIAPDDLIARVSATRNGSGSRWSVAARSTS